MAAIWQITFSDNLSWILIKISQVFVTKGPIDNMSIGLGNGLRPNRQQVIHWTIYVSRDLHDGQHD